MKRHVLANMAGTGWSAFVGLAFLPLYIHLLGIESWGLVGFFLTLSAWLSLLETGMAPAVNREMAQWVAGARGAQAIADLLKSVEWIYAAMATVGATLVAVAAHWIATRWLQAPTLPPSVVTAAVALMGLVIACQWVASLYRNALLGLQRFVEPNAIAASFATLRVACTLGALAVWQGGIVLYFGVQLACVAAEALALRWSLRRAMPHADSPARASWSALGGVWRFASGVAAIALLSTLTTQVDKLILARMLALDQFGYFMLAVSVAGALGFLVGPIYTAAYPRLSELVARGDTHGLGVTYQDYSQALAVCVLPAALMCIFFPFEIVLAWSHDAQLAQNVAPLLSIWMIGTLINALNHMPYAAQLAHGWSRLSMMTNAAAAAIVIPLTLYAVPRWGAIAAAWIWTGVSCAFFVVGLAVMHRRILAGQLAPWLLRACLAPAAAGIAAALCLRAAANRFPMPAAGVLPMVLIAQALVVFTAVALVTPLARSMAAQWVRRLRAPHTS